MKKIVFLFVVGVLALNLVQGLSTNLESSYSPRETMIGEISEGVLAPIQRDQVRVLRGGRLDVGVQYDVGKLGSKHYVWVVAPENSGQYTLLIEDVVALVQGVPEVIDFTHEFSVQGDMIPYSVSPGFVLASNDFTLLANVYGGSDMIDVSFPEQRQVEISPGINYVSFSIEDVLGIQDVLIDFGIYQIPARIIGADFICGDGRIDDIEVCDGDNLGGNDCTTVEGDFIGGDIRCKSGCLVFDKSGCFVEETEICSAEHVGLCETPGTCLDAGGYWYDDFCNENPEGVDECGSEHLELCLNEEECVGAGGHWYDQGCNEYEAGAECGAEHVGLCETPGTCLDAGGYWYDDFCNENPEESCGPNNLSLCETLGTCLDAGGYWYDDFCNDDEETEVVCGDGLVGEGEECDGTNLTEMNCTEIGYDGGNLSCNLEGDEKECMFDVSGCFMTPPSGPPSFIILPGYVEETIFLNSDFSGYRFTVKNNGSKNITNLRFEYNPSKFEVSPLSVDSIGVNQSKEFNISFKDVWWGTPFQGVVVAGVEDIYEYILFDINFTRNETEAFREYGENPGSSGGPSYSCAEWDGTECDSEEVCSGDTVETTDVNDCCIGSCNSPGGDSGGSWIGYLIAGIIIVVGAIIYLRYRGAGKRSGSPLASRVSSVNKKLP